jgi:hypothetical protein
MDTQGHRRAMEAPFKNYMLTIPHRQAPGTYGAGARAKGVKQRIEARDERFEDTARRPMWRALTGRTRYHPPLCPRPAC